MIRKAVFSDLDEVEKIYDEIHAEEEAGRMTVGWIRGVYPTRETAALALKRDDLFVFEEEGRVLASAIINRSQVDVYKNGEWAFEADDSEIAVLHTLTVSPKAGKRGVGKSFVEFYEELAKKSGCKVLRMDTNEKNAVARAFYKKLGFREAGVVPCEFNKIPSVRLVLLEKNLT